MCPKGGRTSPLAVPGAPGGMTFEAWTIDFIIIIPFDVECMCEGCNER